MHRPQLLLLLRRCWLLDVAAGASWCCAQANRLLFIPNWVQRSVQAAPWCWWDQISLGLSRGSSR